jgi:hypothetical protein
LVSEQAESEAHQLNNKLTLADDEVVKITDQHVRTCRLPKSTPKRLPKLNILFLSGCDEGAHEASRDARR